LISVGAGFFREYSRKLHVNILIYPFPVSAKTTYCGVMNLKLTEEQQLQTSDTEKMWFSLF